MKEKVTIKLCNNFYEAWATSQLLAEHHIMVLPNATNKEQPGQGIAITVYETDVEQALKLIAQLENKSVEERLPHRVGDNEEQALKRCPVRLEWRIKPLSLVLAIVLTTIFAIVFSLLCNEKFLPLWGKLMLGGAVGLLVGSVRRN